jgi:hypothetical protein
MTIYKAHIEEQEVELPPEIGEKDAAVKDMLRPYFPEIVNALITREPEKDGVVNIKIVKRAGTKGGWQDLIDIPESRNPVARLYNEVSDTNPRNLPMEMILVLEGQIDGILNEGRRQQELKRSSLDRLTAGRPVQLSVVPEGF